MPQDLQYTVGEPSQEIWKILYNSSTDLTVTEGGVVVLADAPVGVVTINLPAAADNVDRVIIVKVIDATNNVTIDGNGSETIDGATTKTLTTLYEVARMISDGDEWHVL